MSFVLHPVPGQAAGYMSTYPAAWALCGGWAVDAWLGRQTRDHGDIDITVFASDQRALYDHLRDWNLVPHDAVTREGSEMWDGRTLVLPAHIHARPPGEENRAKVMSWVTPPHHTQAADGYDFDLVLNDRDGDAWVLHPEPRIALPLADAVDTVVVAGVPMAVPEVLLFYKATAYHGLPGHPRPHDVADFEALAPHLAPARRAWLRESIAAVVPRHPWLERLSE